MTLYAIYETATGAITGHSEGATAPALPAGYAALQLADSTRIDPATMRIFGRALQPRIALDVAPVTAAAGEAVAIPLPAKVTWLLDGKRYTGPQSVTLANAGSYPLTLIGGWSGQGTVTVLPLTQIKAALTDAIDTAAGDARHKWLTIVPGQSDAYREKMVDVAALNALGGTTTLILSALGALSAAQQKARFPFLYAEMQARGLANLVQARDAIQAAADASRAARAEIERIRRAGKIAVNGAATAIAARAAFDAVKWTA